MQLHPTTESEASSAPPTFDVLPLSHEVRKAVDALGYTHPTPVQRAVFDSVAAGKDVVVQARTGTGKTAAFGLPVVDRIVDVERKKPQVLVLCPTRELALQIHRELELLGKFRGVSVAAIYGGAAINPQIDAIAQRSLAQHQEGQHHFPVQTAARFVHVDNMRAGGSGEFRRGKERVISHNAFYAMRGSDPRHRVARWEPPG